MYAVTIDPFHTTLFLFDRPELAGLPVEENVSIDIPQNLYEWPEGSERPKTILCKALNDPHHYKLFKYDRDINRHEFVPTGTNFGGILSKAEWNRFAKQLPNSLDFLDSADDVTEPESSSPQSSGC